MFGKYIQTRPWLSACVRYSVIDELMVFFDMVFKLAGMLHFADFNGNQLYVCLKEKELRRGRFLSSANVSNQIALLLAIVPHGKQAQPSKL